MDRLSVSFADSARALLCALVVCISGALSAPVQARPLVEAISFHERSDGQGYVIRIHATERIDAYSMPRLEGQELDWTLYNTELEGAFEAVAPQGPVEHYETTVEEGHLTFRFVLRDDVAVTVNAYRDGASDDLLLNLAYNGETPAHAATRPLEGDGRPIAPAADASGSEGGASGDREGRRSETSRERWRLDTIVIDPGHGGKDPGAQAYGIKEKDIVLDVAKKLGGYLEEKLDVRVVYTRTDDRFIELNDRGHIANEAGGKLFISLHANASRARSAHGTETFFLGPHKSEAARRVMERENRVVNLESNPEQYEAFDEEALVRYTLTQSAYMRQSERLAGLVEQQFRERVHRKSRGVKQAGLIVLWSASMPAVLVELGFLSNRSEARFMASEQGRIYLASAIFRAVRAYKAEYEKGMNLARIGGGE